MQSYNEQATQNKTEENTFSIGEFSEDEKLTEVPEQELDCGSKRFTLGINSTDIVKDKQNKNAKMWPSFKYRKKPKSMLCTSDDWDLFQVFRYCD